MVTPDQQPPDVIAPGAFAGMVGRRVPIRIGDGNGPVIGVAEIIGPNGETRMTISVGRDDDPDEDLGASLVFSTAQLAYALGHEPAQQPHVETSTPRPQPPAGVPRCPGVAWRGDQPNGRCGMPLGHHGGCR